MVRLKELPWGGSYVGVMGIDKRFGDVLDNFNRTGGVDTRLVFYKDWLVDAHVAGSQSPGEPSGNNDIFRSVNPELNIFSTYLLDSANHLI